MLNRTSTDEQVALVLQRQLYDAGVDMVIEASRLSDFVRRVGEGKYDALLLDVYAGSNLSFQYAFWHSSFTNWWANFGYSGADKELDALRAARSDADMRAALAELKRVFTDDPPAVFLAWTETARVVSRRLEVPYEAGEDIIRDLWRWRPRRETGAPLAYAANDNN